MQKVPDAPSPNGADDGWEIHAAGRQGQRTKIHTQLTRVSQVKNGQLSEQHFEKLHAGLFFGKSRAT